MNATLRLLLIDDSDDDARLILRELRKGGYNPEWERVCDRSSLEQSLKTKAWDLVICDHIMPGFTSLEAIDTIRKCGLELPILVVSGVAPEELVTSVMRAGAHDFISKNNLLRLVPVVERELREASAHKERRQMAKRLEESEGRYTCLFNENPAPMLLIDAATRLVIDANPSAAAFFGHSVEALQRVALSALIANHDLEAWKNTERHRFSDRVRLADGSARDVDVYAVRIPRGGRILLLATLLDQSGLKQAEHSLERLAAAVEQVTDAIVIAGLDGRVQYANRAFGALIGRDSADIQTGHLHELIPGEDLAEALSVVAQGVPWKGLITLPSELGERLDAYATFSPVRDTVGEDHNLVAVMRDITKERELERQLRQAQKMDALGTLAAGIAHDFNNVLTTILSSAELIKTKIPDDSPIHSKVDAILQAGICASGLNRQILAFSRKSEERHMPMDLTATVRDVLYMLESTLPGTIELSLDLMSGLWVEGDQAQLHQVVLNLVVNACQAIGMKEGHIQVSLSEVGEGEPELPSALSGKRCAVISIRDDGCGMTPEVLERLFEPFFSTKPSGEGTGLGLAMVHTAVSQVGGQIKVSSEVGKGTEFKVYLPCAEGLEHPSEVLSTEDVKGTERILLVEDEEIVAALAKQGLQNLGYSVTTFTDPTKALEEFRTYTDRYDLVITDLAMPEMNGAQLTDQLQDIRSDLPVVLVTGLSPVQALSLSGRADFRGVVAKPFTAYDLAKAVRKALATLTIPLASIGPRTEEPRKGEVRILLAEDSHTTLALIRNWLEQEGYFVSAVKDGMAAWSLFNEESDGGPFDLLLTDVVMPRMDGLELVQLVRRADPSIPIAIFTSNEDQETVKSALHLGVKHYLNKPFEKSTLIQCVERLLVDRVSRLDARRSVETARAVRTAQRIMVAMPEKDLPLYSLYEPLTDAGGDVFRCMRCRDGSILFALADVAGHSVASSYAVASFLALLSAFLGSCRPLRFLLHGQEEDTGLNACPYHGKIRCEPLRHLAVKFNQSIQDGPFSDVPVCALFGYWSPSTGRLHLLNAGIPHAMVLRKEKGTASPVEINGTPLGILPEAWVEEQVIQLQPGDRLLMGTDGFFDVLSPDHKPFLDSAAGQWESLSHVSVDRALSLICETARKHGNGIIADDLMVVAFEQPPLVNEPGALCLHLPSTPQAVDLACERLDNFFASSGIMARVSSDYCFDIALAVREALINAVSHGNHDAPGTFVDMSCRIDKGKNCLNISITDEGMGFDLENHIPPDEPLSERGRGMRLMQNSTGEIHMIGGELTMTFPMGEDANVQR